MGSDRCGPHLPLARVGTAEAYIVEDAARENDGLLRHDGDAAADLAGSGGPDIDSVDQNLAVRRVVEALDEREDGRLAGPRGPNQGDAFSRSYLEAYPGKCRMTAARRIMEAHLLEDNLAVRRLWQTDGFRWRRDLRSLVEKLRDALGGAGGKLHFAPHLRDLTERARGEDGIEHELAQSPARQVPGNDLLGAVPQDADDRSERQEDDRRGKPGAGARALDGGVEGLSGRPFKKVARM